jgi:hypothetical protein
MAANDPERAESDVAAQSSGRTKPLTPAAQRALAEAAARRERAQREQAAEHQPQERQGRGGLEPTRYGDWEVNGLASDF